MAARSAKLGRDHPATLITQNNLALAYDQAGDVARAEPLFRQVLELRKKRRGSGHPHVAETLGDLGWHLIRTKRYVEAETYLREALMTWQTKRPDDWITYQTLSLLGESLSGQKKFAEAEPLLLSGYEGMKSRETKIPAPLKDRLVQAGERVAKLYELTGRKAESAGWRTMLSTTPGRPERKP